VTMGAVRIAVARTMGSIQLDHGLFVSWVDARLALCQRTCTAFR
jgi:hypothetical protein